MQTPITDLSRLTLHVVALGLSAAALFVAAGPLGAAVAGVGVAGGYLTRGVYGVGIHHLGTVALGGVDAITVVGIVLLEAAATFLLVADVPSGQRLEAGAFLVPLAVVLAVGVSLLAQNEGHLIASVALVVVVGLGSYLLHRYGRVRLGLAVGELDQ